MRKRLAIVGHAEEGLSLIPLLESNPDIEVCAIVSDDPDAVLEGLRRIGPDLAERFTDRVTEDGDAILRTAGLVAVIDADPAYQIQGILTEATDRGIQVTTPLIAKLLYAFGPVDATRKPDLLQTLGEILESYNLTVDRRGLLNRILQIAVGATGADRGSLMLIDPDSHSLTVDVAIGIEKEVIPKIRIQPGEGIAGRAFQERRAILLEGKADRAEYDIARERDDVESAISAPLIHEQQVLGVLNLSHARRRGAFDQEDLHFVEQLARIDARIIARADEYHSLLQDSAKLRAQTEVRRILGQAEPLNRRLSSVCRQVAEDLDAGICHIFIHDVDRRTLSLVASSIEIDPLASPIRLETSEGVHGWVARTKKPAVFSQRMDRIQACVAILPLAVEDELLGLLSFEGTVEGSPPEMLHERISALAQALSKGLHDAFRDLRIEREATKASAITEFATRLSASTDSTELHRLVTSSAAMILEAEHSILRLQDRDSGRYQIRSYFGSADTDAQAQLFALEKQLSIEAIKQQAPIRIVDMERRPDLSEVRDELRSALIQPLRHEGRICGTLSVLGKVVQDPLCGESFSRNDQTILLRFAEHVGQTLERVSERERSRHRQRFDELTGLPNTLHLRERLEQEIARCSELERGFAVTRLLVGGLADMLAQQEGMEGDRLVLSIAQELRAGLREFDVIARTAPDTFHVLIPEPDSEIPALLGPLARRARDAICREPELALGQDLDLVFGYALFPEEGRTVKALLDRTMEPRITSD